MPEFRWETNFRETEIGELPKEWKMVRVRDIGTVITGKTPPSREKSLWGGEYPFVTPTDIKDFETRYSYNVERYVSARWLQQSKSLFLPKDAVCFVCIGSTIGKICLLREPSFTNQQLNCVVVNRDNDSRFVYYLLRCNQERITDEYGGGGAAKEIINKSGFEAVELYVPESKDEQSRIASTLSWFDDLIENKKRQNWILEETAMAIFRNWFIEFEPFHDEKLVESELGSVPEGWNAQPIGEIANLPKGISYKGEEKFGISTGFLFITLNNINRGGGFKPEYSWINSNRIRKHQFLVEGELVMANTDMTQVEEVIGSPAIVLFPADYKESRGVYSHHITKIVPKNQKLTLFLYLFLKITQEENTTFSTGTNVLGLDIDNFKRNKLVLIPRESVLEKFDALIKPLFQKIMVNQKQIMVLRKVRDALLPLLIFGKLRVEVT